VNDAIIRGHIWSPSGFGTACYEMVSNMCDRNLPFHVNVLPSDRNTGINEEEYSNLPIMTDNEFSIKVKEVPMVSITTEPYRREKYYEYLFTAIEGYNIPDYYDNTIDKYADEVIVPSNWSKETLVDRMYIDKEVTVIPHGINPNKYTINKPPKRFTFHCVAINDWRKNLKNLVTAFTQEFKSDEARLVIKTNKPLEITPKNVEYDFNVYQFSEIDKMYHNRSAFVSMTRGEGFCIPALQVAARGMPIAITNATGHLDFLYDLFYPIECDGTITRKVTRWDIVEYPNPTIKSAREQMRAIYDDYENACKQSMKLREKVIQEFTWEKAVDKLVETVYDVD